MWPPFEELPLGQVAWGCCGQVVRLGGWRGGAGAGTLLQQQRPRSFEWGVFVGMKNGAEGSARSLLTGIGAATLLLLLCSAVCRGAGGGCGLCRHVAGTAFGRPAGCWLRCPGCAMGMAGVGPLAAAGAQRQVECQWRGSLLPQAGNPGRWAVVPEGRVLAVPLTLRCRTAGAAAAGRAVAHVCL